MSQDDDPLPLPPDITTEPSPPPGRARGSLLPETPPPVLIRRATPSDLGGAWAVEQAAFGETDRFSARQTRGLLANPRARVFVGDARGWVCAWAAMLLRRSRRGHDARLYTIAVAPEMAGFGIGRRLATQAVEAVEREGVRHVTLEVRAENARAIALYESMGFRVVAHLPSYYGEASPGLRMRRISRGS